jgi:hypothetical protein
MTTRPQCEGCGWVCEGHQEKPWEGQHACPAALSTCNATNDGDAPRLPGGFKTEVDKDGWRSDSYLSTGVRLAF